MLYVSFWNIYKENSLNMKKIILKYKIMKKIFKIRKKISFKNKKIIKI